MSSRIFRLFIPLFVLSILSMLCGCQSKDTSDQIYEHAERAFSRGEYQEAEKYYQDYVQHYPAGTQRWEAWHRLISIVRDITRDNLTASKFLEAAYLEFRTDPAISLAIIEDQIELSLRMGNFEEGLTLIDNALHIQKISAQKQWDLLFLQGSLNLRMHRFTQAKISFDLALSHTFDDESRGKTVCALGQNFIYMGEYTQARALLEKAFAKTTPGLTWSRMGYALAEIAEHQGRYQDAVYLLKKIEPHYPTPKVLEIQRNGLKNKLSKK